MLTRLSKFKLFVGPRVWNFFWISVLLGCVGFAIESSFVFILQGFLLSISLLQSNQTFLPAWYPTSLISSVAILLLFGVLRACLLMLKQYYSSMTQTTFVCEQRKSLLSYGLKNAATVSSKLVISAFTEITNQSGLGIVCVTLLINTGISALLFFFAGLRLAPIEMLIGISILSIFLYPLKYTSARITQYGRGIAHEWESLTDSLIRGLKNNFFLSVYKQVDKEISKGNEAINGYQKHYMNFSLAAGFSSAFPMLIGVIVLCLITYCSTQFIHTDPMKLLSFFYVFIRLAQAASEASANYGGLKLHSAAFEKLYALKSQDWLSQKAHSSAAETVLEKDPVTIQVEKLGFGYSTEQMLFSNLDFTLHKKNVLLIKGESGVGKSSLLSVLLGLNSPSQGKVSINGIDTKNSSVDLHKVLAYVGPEAYLNQGTIRENLLYGLDKSVSDAEIWNALEIMELKSLVLGLKLKLDEPLYDIPQLSTGQKQRLSFARALIRKPTLLILDEATANLDVLTEKRIIENLKNTFSECSSIIVTHKNSFDSIATQQINLGG